jgi:hypothetical protein
VLDALRANARKGNTAYFTMLTARPQTVGYGATDSPAGLAADDVLDNITLYWLTNTGASAARLYWRTEYAAASSLPPRRRPTKLRSRSPSRFFPTTSIGLPRHGPGEPIQT